ncbi:hypothetical protein BKA59DRAFT_553675 [Fusarium tricinctum]|uniref:CHAT domain-containing protein n=1 Tax=Fusarium tricinctum TaxID=61284 RepID=A0A8K0S3A4_9HYPO|nr:hypothetical protein BKA59DRAFT_553675 [Fusarium tricinctum]
MTQKSAVVVVQLVCRSPVDGGWAVDLVKNGVTIQQDIRITDPLTPDHKQTCRWYLQQFVQLSPFSVDRAGEAEAILSKYPNQLLGQLPLRQALRPELQGGTYSIDPVTLLFDVFEPPGGVDSGSDNSIQQLFWETLEYRSLWSHPNWQVIVRRCLNYQRTVPRTCFDNAHTWANKNGPRSFNVLLVVARDLTNDPSVYEDVSPSIATNTLLKLRHELNQYSSRIKLNVEMVRPGTFKAFKEHLLRSETMRGPGYFHLVHFDTHGTVALKKSKAAKYGLLHFSQADTDKTEPKAGVQIAKVLKEYHIPFAVLNSCESASATAGDNANIAKLFLQAGLRGVIGMSFKISSSSVAIFLDQFYNQLLCQGKSFAASAAAGRDALRQNPMRPARYGLDRHLSDSFVIVTYEEGDMSSSFSGDSDVPQDDGRPLPQRAQIVGPAIYQGTSDIMLSYDTQELVGREFELLRLEKKLLRDHVICMSGSIGVGKTALLKHATFVWKSTQLIQVVVHIELEEQFKRSGEKLLEDILRQILAQFNAPKLQMLLWTMSTDLNDVASYDSHLLVEILTDMLSFVNAVIVLEYHDPTHLQVFISEDVESLSKSVFDVIQILMSLAEGPGKDTRNNQLYFILTQRRRSLRAMEGTLGRQLEPFRFDLSGLRLSDAIELSKRVLSNAGEPVEHWKSEDSRSIPWRRFHKELEKGLFTSVSDLKSHGLGGCAIVRELESMYLPKHYELLVLLISLFWHKAPPMSEYVYLSIPIADEFTWDQISSGFGHGINCWYSLFKNYVHDRGYIYKAPDGYNLEVHPMFSIVGRAFLFDTWVNLSNRVQLETIFCATLYLSCTSPRHQNPPLQLEPWNYLTVLGFCTRELPVDSWPLGLLLPREDWKEPGYPSCLVDFVRERQFELLGALSFKMPLLVKKGEHLAFFAVANLLVCSLVNPSNKSTMESVLHFAKKGQDIMSTLDPAEDKDVIIFSRASILTALIASSHSLGDLKQAHEAWKQIKVLDEELHLTALPRHGHRPVDISESFGKRSWFDDQKLLISECIQTFKDDMEKWENGTLSASEVKDQQALVQESLQIFLDMELMFPPSINSRDDVALFLLSGPSTVPREPSSEIDPHKLSDLESSYDAGNWLDTCERHISMAIEALLIDQFEEVSSHLESVYTLAKSNSAAESFIVDIQASQNRIYMAHLAYVCHVTLFPARYFYRGVGYGFARKMNDTLHRRFVNQRFWGSQALLWPSEEQNHPLSKGCKWWQWWHWFLALQGQEKAWVTCVRANLGLYLKEGQLMDLIFILSGHNRFDSALILLDELELICNNSVFVHVPTQLSPLQCLRSCFELAFRQSSLGQKLDTWQFDSTGAQGYQALVTQLLELRPSFCTWFPDKMVEGFQYAADRFKLYNYQVTMREAAQSPDPTVLRTTYQQLVSSINDGSFCLLNDSDLLTVRAFGLRYSLDRARNDRRWQEAISLCEEYLSMSQASAEDLPRAQDSWVVAKHECEWYAVSDALEEAEANLCFESCSKLLRKKYDMACRQRRTPGMRRDVFFLVPPRLYSFQLQIYQDHCLDCLDWLRHTQDHCKQHTESSVKQKLGVLRHQLAKELVLGHKGKKS